jgi:hypothetical protein
VQKASGDVVIIRYADDLIVGFQHEHEATTFLRDLHGDGSIFPPSLANV